MNIYEGGFGKQIFTYLVKSYLSIYYDKKKTVTVKWKHAGYSLEITY